MYDKIKQLKGSPYRDAFKYWHKYLEGPLYAIDIDLALIEFRPEPSIKIVIDAKHPLETELSSSHKCAYDWFESKGIHVYLISPLDFETTTCEHCGKGDIIISPDSKVKITRYLDGKSEIVGREEYIKWELNWRRYISKGD